jgi:hypothetical protein
MNMFPRNSGICSITEWDPPRFLHRLQMKKRGFLRNSWEFRSPASPGEAGAGLRYRAAVYIRGDAAIGIEWRSSGMSLCSPGR